MINKIKEFFNKKTREAEDDSHSVLNIATAALLIEVMTIDGNMDQEEMDSVKSNLSTILELSDGEIQELNDEDAKRNASGGNVQINFNGRGLI